MPTGAPTRVGSPSTARIGCRAAGAQSGQRGSTRRSSVFTAVEDERVDARPLARHLVRELEAARATSSLEAT